MTDADPATVNPEQVLEALKAAGFTVYSTTPGQYVRMQWPPDAVGRDSVIVPFNRNVELMRSTLEALSAAAAAGAAAQRALQAINATAPARNTP